MPLASGRPPSAGPPPVAPPAAPPAGGPPPTAPTTDSYGFAPRRRSRAKTIVVIALVVVLVIVVAGVADVVLFRPAVTGTTNGPAPVGTAFDEVTAARAGEARENSTAGGPWTPTAIFGLGLTTGYNGTPGFISGCSTVWENSSNLLLPSTATSASSGEVAGWLIFASDPSGELLATSVAQVGPTVVASDAAIFKGSCTETFTTLGSIPTGVEDSPTVVAATNAMGGTAFLSTHAVVSVELLLLGAYWSVEYSTCSFFATSGTGTNFTALFDATTGASLGPATTINGDC